MAAHSCAKRGLSASSRDRTNVVLRKDVSARFWEAGAWEYYVCSRKYGRLVYIGDVGTTADGPVWSAPMAMNSRYAAVVGGYGGNADGERDTSVELFDLKTGKQVWTGSPSPSGEGEENYVPTVALSRSGSIGWINQGDGVETEVNVRFPGKRARRLSVGNEIDSQFLRWSQDGKRLIWTDSPTTIKYAVAKYKPAKASNRGSCVRRGDHAAGRDSQYVYVTRRFRGSGWKNGRVLIACSLTHKHRVAIARSGERGENTYSFETPTVTEGFAAVVIHRSTGGADERQWIASYDLSRGVRTCLAAAGPLLNDPSVGAIGFNSSGALFWNVSGETQGSLDDVPTTTLRVCEEGRSKALLTDINLDPAFLRMGENDDAVVVVTKEKSGF